ncbi:MAG: DcaP family trimeric outer membrane transporter [Burkholderiales bacterium]
MKLKLTIAALATACAYGVPPVQAQTIEEMRVEMKKLRDELNELKKAKADAAPKPADSSGWGERVEALEIKSKDAVVLGDINGGFRLPGSETSLRIYGYAEAHAIHDFRQSSSPDIFTDPTFQPPNNAGGLKGKTKFTAETSRFGFETSTPTSLGTFNTKVEADFYSYGSDNRNRLRLRHAYGEYGGWLIGQTWSTFMDLDDLPETVDFNGPIGAPFSRRTMVRYTYGDAKAGYKFSFAAEDPEDQFGGGSSNERMPQLVARFDKSFDWGAVNARVLAHEKRSPTQIKRGYGVGVGGSYKLTDKDLFMGQYTSVDGDVDQLYGSNGYAIDAGTGEITFDKNQGLVLGYTRTFNEQLRGSFVLGFNRGKTAAAVDNKSIGQLFLNLIYSPIKNVELGGEFIYGQRKTFDGDKGTLSRFDLMGRYSF